MNKAYTRAELIEPQLRPSGRARRGPAQIDELKRWATQTPASMDGGWAAWQAAGGAVE